MIFAAAFSFLYPAWLTPAAGQTGGTSKAKAGKVKSTVLFISWDHVYKGRMEPVIDPSQVSEKGWEVIHGLEKSWNRVFQTNGPGMKMYLAPRNIHITAEKARKEPFTLKADRPWEEHLDGLSFTILQEKGLMRCWYGVNLPREHGAVDFQQERAVESGGTAFCYAESKDGFTWTKPNLGVLSFQGSKDNNIVNYMTMYASVFHDKQGAPDEQYKTFGFGKLPPEELAKSPGGSFNSYCLYAIVSPDGYHWHSLSNAPLIRHFCDTQNVGAWDPLLKKYVGFFRDHQGGRAISRSETTDFHNWPPPTPVLEPSPEEDADGQYYNNCYTTYPDDPSIRLLFPSVYHTATDRVDVRMAMSPEGRAFGWVSHQPVIELGQPGEWDSGQIYASPNLVRRGDGRLGLVYAANPHTHNEGFLPSFYKNYSVGTQCGWAVWEDGRLAGIEPRGEGEFYSQPVHPDGEILEINARTEPGGSVKVELCEEDAPFEGFSLADNIPFEGDQVWEPVRWKDNVEISKLKGKKVYVHFVLNKAKIFGYRVATKPTDKNGRS